MVHSRFIHGVPRSPAPLVNTATGTGRGGFVALGVLLIGVGVGAMLFPLVAALSFNLVVGTALLAGGILTLAQAARMRRWRGFAAQTVMGVLYAGAGLIFIANPFAGLFALAVLLGAFFAADGAARIILALKLRPRGGWGMFLVSGVLSAVLGAAMLISLPSGLPVAVIGALVGLNLILAGASFLTCTPDARTASLGSLI